MNDQDLHARDEAEDEAASTWLITFSDLVALMLAFFVMMYATQKIETGGWQAMIQSLSQSLKTDSVKARHPVADRNISQRSPEPAVDLSYLATLIQSIQESDPALAGIAMKQFDDRLVIALPKDLLFRPGHADPEPRALPRIRMLADLFSNISNRIDVFGHSDPSLPNGLVFESNRELSLARAEAVVAMIRSAGYPRRVGAFGMGEKQYGDLSGIRSRAVRDRVARRVDIVVRPEAEWRK